MEPNLQKQLKQACTCYNAWRLHEAYAIFRRYFDRLPFSPEEGHAEYIGMFSRILFELGKEGELAFYSKELERLYQKTKLPFLGFALGSILILRDPEKGRLLLEDLLREPSAASLHVKAKFYLAHYYDLRDDISTCRQIIDSIGNPGEHALHLESWKAKILRDEGKLSEASEAYRVLIPKVRSSGDWYLDIVIRLQMAHLYRLQGNKPQAVKGLEELQELLQKRPFKSLLKKVSCLEESLREKTFEGRVQLITDGYECHLRYENRRAALRSKSPAEKLFLLFCKRRTVEKAHIVEAIYNRQYSSASDDSLVYFHIHSARKILKELGLPTNALGVENGKYRFLPEIEKIKEEL